MKVGTLFSGIEGFGLGFQNAGAEIIWQVENEPFCIAVLETHWPAVQRFADVRDVGRRNLAPIDCICAGVPCQDVSVAGKRAGLAGERTELFYEFARILQELRPAWFVFENVPGLFSSNSGRDFAEILRVLMVECGYGISWRVLDSQYFGVAQQRRRVFIVGSLGKPCPAEILFESESGGGNIAESGEARQGVAAAITGGTGRVGSRGADDGANIVARTITQSCYKHHDEDTDTIVIEQNTQCSTPKFPSLRSHGTPNYGIAHSLRESDGHHGRSSPRGDGCDNLIAGTLRVGGREQGAGSSSDNTPIVIQDVRGGTRDRIDDGQGIGIREGGPSYTLGSTEQHAVAFAENQRGEIRTSEVAPQLSAGGGKPGSGYPAVAYNEVCGTLHAGHQQGGWSPNAEEAAEGALVSSQADSDGVRDFAGLPKGMDSPRYRALGNAVTVQVAQWIATRLIAVHNSLLQKS